MNRSAAPRQVHLAAHFVGSLNNTVWTDPLYRGQIDFSTFTHFARNAERGFFDYLFLAEGLRPRHHLGRIHELDAVGRPATFAQLAALAAVTENIGLIGTLTVAFNEPYELARQFATLDHLSGGRAGWNVVTTADDFFGVNFRRGAYLPSDERYRRAGEFVEAALALWDAWALEEAPRAVSFRSSQFDFEATPTVPRSPQGRPVLLQSGVSAEGRDLAARHADAIFSPFNTFDAARSYYDDVKGRLAEQGRHEDSLKILPYASFVIGNSERDARDRARELALAQVTPEVARAAVEAVWGRELSDLDPDGPVPGFDPDAADIGVGQAKVAIATAQRWRAQAEAQGLSVRELIIQNQGGRTFVGTPMRIADDIDRFVQERACDGFVFIGATSSHGLDEFVELVVPELQDRGVHRSAYPEGAMLRDLLDVGQESADA